MSSIALNASGAREWFDKLAPRERWLVGGAAVFALFAIVFAAGVRPLAMAKARAAAEIERKAALLNDVELVARRFGPQVSTGDGPAPSTGDSLVVVIDRSTREHALGPYLKRNQPEGTNGVRLRLEGVPFDQLLEWLVDLQTQHGLGATSASFDPTGDPGRVNSNLILNSTGR